MRGWHKEVANLIILFIILMINYCLPQPIEDDEEIFSIKNRVVVDTSLGKVVGITDGKLNTFLGIPYAEPPTRTWRFRPSRNKRPWYPQVYKATKFSPECLQSTLYSSAGEGRIKDEDCLYLNIWAPATNRPSQVYPVMVWIYGGAFLHGSAWRPEYIGNKLALRDVVVVTFNYRVGALGFLVSTIDGLYGNYGLHDQKGALQWVQDHIGAFGGDRNRVTLFGESAGAMSIGLHFLEQEYKQHVGIATATFSGSSDDGGNGAATPQENNNNNRYNKEPKPTRLFHAVILQSNPLGYKYRSVTVANFIGLDYKKQLDCEDVKCLQSESADELIHIQDTMMAVPRSIGDFFTWGPVVTDASYYREARLRPNPNPYPTVSNVSVLQPFQTIAALRRLDLPILIGANSHEGNVFVFTAFPTRMPKVIYQTAVFSFFRQAAPQVLKMYSPLTKYISESPYPDYRLGLSIIIGDYLFRCPNLLFANKAASLKGPVYLYEFALPTRVTGYPCCDGMACHTAELPYPFNQLQVIEAEYSYTMPAAVDDSGILFAGDESGEKLFPDIFGAVHKTTGNSNSTSNSNGAGGLEIDTLVSSMMADFWASFATYGDPNGLPTENGYVKRAGSYPLWPTLHKTLPGSIVMQQMNYSFKTPINDFLGNQAFISKEQSGRHRMEYQDDDDDSQRGNSNGNDNTISTGSNGNINSKNDNDDYDDFNFSSDDDASDTFHEKRMQSINKKNLKIKRKTKKRSTKVLKSQPTHMLKFEEDSAVYLVENDCMCDFWNQLSYQF